MTLCNPFGKVLEINSAAGAKLMLSSDSHEPLSTFFTEGKYIII